VKLRATLAVAAAACVAVVVVAPVAPAASPNAATAQGVTVPITPAQSGGVLDGVLTITGFAVNDVGQLVANGVFTGTATVNGVTQAVTSAISVPITQASGSCSILDLTLGPLHLNLLGLVVDLNQVHLQISAQPGAGNLLGNLLCSVAHLLDSNASAQGLASVLNNLLRAL
jgi:hypothetical protein